MARTKILVPQEKQCGYTSVIVSYSTGLTARALFTGQHRTLRRKKYSCCTATLAQNTA